MLYDQLHNYCIKMLAKMHNVIYNTIINHIMPYIMLYIICILYYSPITHKMSVQQDFAGIFTKVKLYIACTASLTWVNEAQAVSIQLHSKNNYSVVLICMLCTSYSWEGMRSSG